MAVQALYLEWIWNTATAPQPCGRILKPCTKSEEKAIHTVISSALNAACTVRAAGASLRSTELQSVWHYLVDVKFYCVVCLNGVGNEYWKYQWRRIISEPKYFELRIVGIRSRSANYMGGADKSSARPGRKQATATKLGNLFNILPTKLSKLLSPLL